MPDGMLRLATWNVNSIRTRLGRVLDWLERAEVDVLAMQETKCSDEQFPTLPFFELGYEVAHCGFNQWNGVAIASRVGLENVEVGFDGQPSWSSKPDVAAAAEARALGELALRFARSENVRWESVALIRSVAPANE